MKKTIFYVSVVSSAFLLINCKSKKSAAGAAPSTFIPASPQIAAAEKRWPGTNTLDLREGHTIFTTKCTRCHPAVEITTLSEKKWLHEIDEMSPKAELTADEKLRLTKYVLSYREAYTASK
jgi:hypothetical protein